MIRSVRSAKPREAAGPRRTEHAEAVTFWKMVKYHEPRYPALRMLFAVPNGGDRHKIVAAKMRAEGVRPGVSDYIALVPRGTVHGLAIELKAIDGSASKEQRQFISDALANGYRAEVARGWQHAWAIVCSHFDIPQAGA